MGANPAQLIKAFKEAESYDGPSIVICYSPCIEHGIKGGLKNHQITEKKAVECGYWTIFRYDPRLALADKNPLQIDFKRVNFDLFKDFISTETRYSQLKVINPDNVERLFDKCQSDAEYRYMRLTKLAEE